MNKITDCYTLSNGVQIPCIGFGTWQSADGEEAYSAVRTALDCGYRHIDTAAIYGNEKSVGRAVRSSGIPRGELFITTKLWNTEHSYEKAKAAFTDSMDKLGLDYLDLYLIHWPNPLHFRDRWAEANAEAWRAMEELYTAEKVCAIGISNFLPRHIDPLLNTAKVVPMVNQLRLCPGDIQPAAVAASRAQGMLLQAYSPFGTGKIFTVPEMQALAEKYGKTIAQICVRWSLQLGFNPLPKSVTPDRIAENAAVFDFTLDDADVALIESLTGCVGMAKNPDETPF